MRKIEEFNAGLFCPFWGTVCQINLHPTLHCQARAIAMAKDAHMDKSRFIFMNGFSKLALYQGSLVIVQRLVRELWDNAGHDDPLGQRRVLPVGDHHLRLPTLRHRAQVEVQERLALQHWNITKSTLIHQTIPSNTKSHQSLWVLQTIPNHLNWQQTTTTKMTFML